METHSLFSESLHTMQIKFVLKCECSRKPLQPADSIKVSPGLPLCYSKCSICIENPRSTACLSYKPLTDTFHKFPSYRSATNVTYISANRSPATTKFYTQLTVHAPRGAVAGGDKRHLVDKVRILHFASLHHFLRLSSVAFGKYVGLLVLWPRNSVHCRDDPSPDYRQITAMIYILDFQFTFWTLGKRILTLWEPRVANANYAQFGVACSEMFNVAHVARVTYLATVTPQHYAPCADHSILLNPLKPSDYCRYCEV
jgi:hypothetical protein